MENNNAEQKAFDKWWDEWAATRQNNVPKHDAARAAWAAALQSKISESVALQQAAVQFRDGLVPRTYPLWHGWALYDAFLAGAAFATSAPAPLPGESLSAHPFTLHLLRNAYGYSEETLRGARLNAANIIEHLERQIAAAPQPAERVGLMSPPCCEEYATCLRPCTPRGEWIAQQTPQPAPPASATGEAGKVADAIAFTSAVSAMKFPVGYEHVAEEAERVWKTLAALRASGAKVPDAGETK